MFKIGMRNIKTAISVFICLAIYFLIILIAYSINGSLSSSFRKATQLYTPFFACLATAYSISTNREKSNAQGRLRLVSSFIGGVFGLIVVALYQLTGHDWPFQHISSTGNATYDKAGLFETGWLSGNTFTEADITFSFLASFIIPCLLIALSVIFIIWFCNKIKRSECCFIAVLTLTAVTASLGTNPIIYGPNRILSTMIGIVVALIVNNFRIPYRKNKNASFVFSLDGLIDKDTQKLSGYTKYNINHMLEHNMDLYLYTTRSPRVLSTLLTDIDIKNPIVCMCGACTYDFKNKKYANIEYINDNTSQELSKYLQEMHINPFVLTIKDEVIHIGIEKLTNNGQISYVSIKRDANYVVLDVNKNISDANIVSYVIVDETNQILRLKERLENKHKDLVFQVYDSYDNYSTDGKYSYLKVYSKEIEKFREKLNITKRLYGFGVNDNDSELFKICDESYTTTEASTILKNSASQTLVNRVETNRCLFRKAIRINKTNK